MFVQIWSPPQICRFDGKITINHYESTDFSEVRMTLLSVPNCTPVRAVSKEDFPTEGKPTSPMRASPIFCTCKSPDVTASLGNSTHKDYQKSTATVMRFAMIQTPNLCFIWLSAPRSLHTCRHLRIKGTKTQETICHQAPPETLFNVQTVRWLHPSMVSPMLA